MTIPLLIAILCVALGCLAAQLLSLFRSGSERRDEAASRRFEERLRADFSRQREELQAGLGRGFEALFARLDEIRRAADEKSDQIRGALDGRLREFGEGNDVRLTRLRQELNDNAESARTGLREAFAEFQKSAKESASESASQQRDRLAEFGKQIEKVGTILETRLGELQAKNEAKLEEMRKTVDEKLQSTLEKRLGESFKVVSDNLERVTKSLGEMQQIAAGVGDLKRVLTNVKARGTWGEIQLGALLEQVLSPDQYLANVAVKPGSAERVEFAIRLPGQEERGEPVWLPIDAKFPQEDYLRLLDALERADAAAASEAGKALETRIRQQAKEIREKYIAPPSTTDFGLLFLPSEGLYAEALRRPGLCEALQREHRVVLAGPTTLAALLNSLQMGFRTLAIQQRSGEVWRVLGAVKTEFGKFGDVLDKVKKKLDEASTQIDSTAIRTRAITRRLRGVEALPSSETAELIPDSTEPSEEFAEEGGEP
jgi:DNA recombination protein RmuC